MASRPGMSPQLQAAWEGLARGVMPNPEQFTVRDLSLWHRQNIGTAAPTRLSWFNVAGASNVSNMPQASVLPNETAAYITNIRVHLARGYQVDGTAEADGLAYQADIDPLNVASDYDLLMSYGHFVLSINGREYVNRHGLYHFPSGGGVYVSAAHATTASTVTYSLAVPSNGFPDARNKASIPAPIPLPPGKGIECTTAWNIGPTLKDAYVLKVELEGIQIFPANN